MKLIRYEFNQNTLYAILPSGQELELTDILTKAQIKKLERTAARRIHRAKIRG